MIRIRTVVMPVLCAALFSSLGAAQDLSKYRDFQFGLSVEAVTQQIHANASQAKTTHLRPALIQTLLWEQYSFSSSAVKTDSVRNIRFDFYNGDLSKMVVTYDPAGTEGLTTADMIEAISVMYGPATRPERTILVATSGVYEDNQSVLACWEDAQYSYNLFRSTYGNAFGLVAFSKKLDMMANLSIREADRLDKLEAPEKELARQVKLEEDRRLAEEKARLVTKPKFRP